MEHDEQSGMTPIQKHLYELGDDFYPATLRDEENQWTSKGTVRILAASFRGLFVPQDENTLRTLKASKAICEIHHGETLILPVHDLKLCNAGPHFHFCYQAKGE